jgi:hypothetical protein
LVLLEKQQQQKNRQFKYDLSMLCLSLGKETQLHYIVRHAVCELIVRTLLGRNLEIPGFTFKCKLKEILFTDGTLKRYLMKKKKLSEIFMTNDGQSVQATHLKHFQFILDFPFEIIIPQNVGYTFFLLHIWFMNFIEKWNINLFISRTENFFLDDCSNKIQFYMLYNKVNSERDPIVKRKKVVPGEIEML